MAKYTSSPLGIIPINDPSNESIKEFYDGGKDIQESIFSSKHKIRIDEAGKKTGLFGGNPLKFPQPSELHTKEIYDISTSNIIKQLEEVPSMRLKWSDFAYCRDYGVYPNNRLIICRRFNNPVLDDLTFNSENMEPLSTLVTWLPGDQSDALSFDFGESWVDAEASFTTILNSVGDDIGLGKVLKLGDALESGLNTLPAPGATEILQRRLLKSLGIISGKDTSSEIIPSGTPNLIKEARQRKLIKEGTPGSGLVGKLSVKVTCAWEQKFISGVDPTFIYFDILRTVLSFGGSDAVFYLGKRSNLGQLDKFFQDYIENGPIEQIKKVLNALKDKVNEIIDDIKGAINKVIGGIKESAKTSEEREKEAEKNKEDADTKKEQEAGAQAGIFQGVKNALDSFINSFANTLIKKYRVAILGVVSALTGLPSTPWHVTIGNPLRPILTSGDMECTGVSVKLGSQLSFNDLPSYIECSFTLTSARNLGIDEIFEKLSNSGLRISEEPGPSFWNTEPFAGSTSSNDLNLFSSAAIDAENQATGTQGPQGVQSKVGN